ncbi:exosome catalytic subunit dis3 [Blastocladiella emersonii ATCC 22665]|nr:exosome catalytic subunit dis3 [Blastocladiella emersonii ATCC 22665]
MLRNKAFTKKTKRGGIVKVVRENYLQDDVYCSSQFCTACPEPKPVLSTAPPALDGAGPHYLVPDTNVFLHNIDFMENPATKDVIVCQTVLDEVRHRNLNTYNRLKALLANPDRRFYSFANEHHRATYVDRLDAESPNDRNDRAIRVAAKWYADHLAQHPVTIVMLSDDLGNRTFAAQEKLKAMRVAHYAARFSAAPELVDLVAASESTAAPPAGNPKFAYDYPEHLAPSTVGSAVLAGTLYQGTLQIAAHNANEAYIIATVKADDGSPLVADNKIYVQGRKHLNRAMQGDVVAIELFPRNAWIGAADQAIADSDDDDEEDAAAAAAAKIAAMNARHKSAADAVADDASTHLPTGRVVSIIRRNWRSYCGSVEKAALNEAVGTSQEVLFHPVDRRIPKIRMRTSQGVRLAGMRIVVTIDAWDRRSKYPAGHFVRVLGPTQDKETETQVILLEHGVPYEPFSAAVLKDLPAEGEAWTCSPDELARRRDLRHLPVCSIDPPGCTDIDDALHVRPLPNGNLEVGVHIADVTHFVKPNTAMDKEAAKRGTTVYLVDKRIDMLPGLLGTNLCSLRSNVDRLAFSCLWEMTHDAEIVKVKYVKSIIHSKASFTYEEAQRRIDDPRCTDEVTEGVRNLNKLAKQLRARRLANGALTLASPEVRFRLEGDAQDPVDVELKELKDTNALVEEFMLLANVSVAEKIFNVFPNTAMLRCHPEPAPENFLQLNQALARFGIQLATSSSKALSDSLDKAVLPHDPYFNQLVRIMTTRCMMQAQYFCSGVQARGKFRHYGLAMPIYTHFTSPIRRYADVIVHRLLAASIAHDSFAYGQELTDRDTLDKLSGNLNHRNRMAQQASRSSVELFTNVYFRGKVLLEPAYITRVLKNGVAALIPKYGVEANIPLDGNVWKYNPADVSLEATGCDTPLRMFGHVTVRIEVLESTTAAGTQKVVMTLTEPAVGESAAAATAATDAGTVAAAPASPMDVDSAETSPKSSPAKTAREAPTAGAATGSKAKRRRQK